MINEKAFILAIRSLENLIQGLYSVDKRIGIALVFDDPEHKNGTIMCSNLKNEAVKRMLVGVFKGLEKPDGIENILKKAREDYEQRNKT